MSGFFFDADGEAELAGLGLSGSEGVEGAGIFALGEFSSAGSEANGGFAVAKVLVGIGGVDPGEVAERIGEIWIPLQGGEVIVDGEIKLSAGHKQETQVVMGFGGVGAQFQSGG